MLLSGLIQCISLIHKPPHIPPAIVPALFLTFLTTLEGTILPPLAQAVPTKGHRLMIAAVSPHAVELGKQVALKGGNVVDVAVTVALTLSVTHPYYAALGGGGFALVKMGKKGVRVLDFREKAPGGTSPNFYLNKAKRASLDGGHAIGVPGIPAGLWALHQKYGKLSWSQLLAGPIELARKGFRVSGEWVRITHKTKDRFTASGQKFFLKEGKAMYKPGSIFKQKALAQALKKIRDRNTFPFYHGDLAQDMVKSIKKAGGILSLQDLKNYKVRWLSPLTTNFHGHKIYLMPPPSSGGLVIQSALSLMHQLQLKKLKPMSVDEFHMIGEVLSRSFRGRSLLGDPDFHKNPINHLLSPKYLSKMAQTIHIHRTQKITPLSLPTPKEGKESHETTHLSVLDHKGNAVTMTITLNGGYGSGVVSEKYGIALNNEMDDFTTHPGKPNLWGLVQGSGNQVQPGKRPLSSMSPTLVEKNNKIIMSLGAPGGPTIISGVLQTLYRLIVTGWDVDRAIQAPRVHHQFLPHTLYLDEGRFFPETIEGLKKRGHKTQNIRLVGRIYAIRQNKDGVLEAAHDSRGEGASGGY